MIKIASLTEFEELLFMTEYFEKDLKPKIIYNDKYWLKNKLKHQTNIVSPFFNYYMFFKDEVAVAYIGLSIDEHNLEDGFIDEIYVKPEFRNKKIAQNLVEYSLQWFEKNKCENIDVNSENVNEAALSLFKKMDFDIVNNQYIGISLNK